MAITCKVSGEFAQNITCQLDADQSMFADASKFRWKTTNVSIETRLSVPGGEADAANQEAKKSSDRELKDSYNERMAKLAQLRRNPIERWKVQRELRGLTVERNRRYPPVP